MIYELFGGFHLVDLIIIELKSHMTCDNSMPLLLVEITAFRLERIFQPMRALEFITGHVVYKQAYN